MAEVITRFKVDSGQFDKKVNSAKKQLDDFAKSAGLSMKSFSKMGIAAAAVAGSMKVIGDAFKQSEGLSDSWRASIEMSKSAYKSFLTSLNTGNFSNFLSGLREITQAAEDAYNSLDELGTYQAFTSRGNAKNRAAYAEALAAYKENPTAANKIALTNANNAIVEELNQQSGLVAKAYSDGMMRLALEQGLRGSAADNFVSMFKDKSWYELVAAKNGYARGTGLNGLATYWNGYEVQGNSLITRNAGGVVTERREMNKAEKAAFEFARALSEVTDEELKAIQALGAQEFALQQAAADQTRSFNRMAGNNGGGGSTFKAPKGENIARLSSLSYAKVNGADILDASLPAVSERIDKVTSGTRYAAAEAFKMKDAWMEAANCIAMAGSAMQNLESPAARVTGILAEAIANIALGFGSAAKNQGATGDMWEWIAASISGAATMVSTIAAVKQATKGYAQGGIVGSLGYGMSSSGDNIVARLNKGEGVLTRAGIDNAETLFSGGSFGGLFLETRVSGEDLAIVLDNNNRRRGRGKTIR